MLRFKGFKLCIFFYLYIFYFQQTYFHFLFYFCISAFLHFPFSVPFLEFLIIKGMHF